MKFKDHLGTLRRGDPPQTGPRDTNLMLTRLLLCMTWVLTVASLLAAVVLIPRNHLSAGDAVARFDLSSVVLALSFLAAGSVVVLYRPRFAVGWTFVAVGFGTGVGLLLNQYTVYDAITRPGSLPGKDVAIWLSLWTWMPVMGLALIFLPLFFPDGRLPSNRWRPFLCFAIAVVAVTVLLSAFGPATDGTLPGVENPFALWGNSVLVQTISVLNIALILTALVGAITSVIYRARRADDEQRQQLKWFVFATAVFVAALSVPPLLNLLYPSPSGPFLVGLAQAVAAPSIPLAAAIAILRYRLFDIDLLINRTLVYGTLTTCVVGL